VATLRTTAGSPFYFNFHVGDLGHTFICGPSGSGKTVVQNFMLAQLERFDAQQMFIDKDRGAEIFLRGSDGSSDFATFGGGELTNRGEQPVVDADVLHLSAFGSNLPLKRV
jgi:DNA helicase HerA-like ATPase